MIYCPQCGTPNKPNSKFCKNCAAVLMPSTDVRCPICGTMNPQSAATCSNCGTRLTTTSATPSDTTTPADTPENITPFTPPDLAPDANEGAASELAPTSTRALFSRTSSSEWLKRVQKTQSPDTAPTPSVNASSVPASTPLASSDAPEWLREIQVEADDQDKTQRETQPPPVASEPPAPANPVLSEIKLTGDDYDYSDIGGQVTDEMKATLEANASNVQSVDDEIALARKLLGLDSVAEVMETPHAQTLPEAALPLEMSSVPEAIAEIETPAISEITVERETTPSLAQVETTVPSKPALSEIKLTGDDYDYSDIGGQVTDEMKATLEAQVGSVQSVEDEIALARRLLGLDVETTSVEPQPVQPPIAETSAPTQAAPPSEEKQETPEWVTALAAASSAAVAANVVSKVTHGKEEAARVETPILETPSTEISAPDSVLDTGAETPVVEIVPLETAPPISEAITETRTAESIPVETGRAIVEPVVELPSDDLQPIAEIPIEEASSEIVAPIKPSAPALEAGEMPVWLREIAPREFAPPDIVEGDVVASQTQQDGEMHEWVREYAPKDLAADAAMTGTSALLARLPDLDEQERGDLPDWLREPIEPPAAETPAETISEQGPPLATPLELPDWFSGAPAGATLRDPFEVIETTGPLAGVSGILPLAIAITEPHTLTTPTPARSDGGRIFQTLVAEPLTPTSSAHIQEKSQALFTAKHLMYLLILLAALLPLFFSLDQAGLGLDATKSPSALFYDQLSSVGADETVLLAFDYTPGQAVELDPVARAIVNELGARRANVIAVSSNPNGATIAQTVLQRAQEIHPNFVFVNIGYIPGNEAGLRALASGWLPASRADVNGVPWGGSPLAQKIRDMDELALSVILAGDDPSLRAWVEQVEPRVTSPLLAATSAMIEPQTRNYVNANQLQASLHGLTGAAELELLSNNAGQAVKTVDALSFVTLVLAGIVIAANVVWLMRRGKR